MSSPVGKEQAQTNSLKDTGKGSHCDSVERTLLGEDLRDELHDTHQPQSSLFERWKRGVYHVHLGQS